MQQGQTEAEAAAARQAAEPVPELSIVIASVNGYPFLAECLLSLERQAARDQLEVIVVDRLDDGTAEQAGRDFPTVRVLRAAPDRSVPQLRSQGLRVARAAIVAITEDHVVAPPEWAAAILDAHARYPAAAAIGGPVDNYRTASALDWASFLCEYSEFLPPLAPEATAAIPGMNTSYKRRAIAACGDLFYAGVWETFLHARLLELGEELRAEPAILLHHNKSFGWGEFLSQRYYLARSFAGMRVAGGGLARRLAFTLASPALLPLLAWRIARRALRKGFGRELRRAAPTLLVFLLSWTVGEFAGYACGEGEASARVA